MHQYSWMLRGCVTWVARLGKHMHIFYPLHVHLGKPGLGAGVAQPKHLQPRDQWRFFQNWIKIFLDTLSLYMYFLMIKLNSFRGDLSDISAKTAALQGTYASVTWFHCQASVEKRVSSGLEPKVEWCLVWIRPRRNICHVCPQAHRYRFKGFSLSNRPPSTIAKWTLVKQ